MKINGSDVGLKRLILYIHLINIILQFEKGILENTKMNKTITNDKSCRYQ